MITTYTLLSSLTGPSLVRYLIFVSVFGKYTGRPVSREARFRSGNALALFSWRVHFPETEAFEEILVFVAWSRVVWRKREGYWWTLFQFYRRSNRPHPWNIYRARLSVWKTGIGESGSENKKEKKGQRKGRGAGRGKEERDAVTCSEICGKETLGTTKARLRRDMTGEIVHGEGKRRGGEWRNWKETRGWFGGGELGFHQRGWWVSYYSLLKHLVLIVHARRWVTPRLARGVETTTGAIFERFMNENASRWMWNGNINLL